MNNDMKEDTAKLLEILKARVTEAFAETTEDGDPLIRYPRDLIDMTNVIKEIVRMEKDAEPTEKTETRKVTFLPVMPID
ncbi:hypothetical protein AHIS1_p070 [Acaryochloris phage A-HIS1]|nr:hypothetical protein AHIS1_p070 [Acaryochloris phage A-HIS1]